MIKPALPPTFFEYERAVKRERERTQHIQRGFWYGAGFGFGILSVAAIIGGSYALLRFWLER